VSERNSELIVNCCRIAGGTARLEIGDEQGRDSFDLRK
jgi:hypothetical protein